MRGLRAGSYYTRLLRVLATYVLKTPAPACTCKQTQTRYTHTHSVACPRWLHLRISAQLSACGLTAYAAPGKVLDEMEAQRGTRGGAEAQWRGGGMDPAVSEWLAREIMRAQERAAMARTHRDETTAHDSRVRALKNIRTALRRYAEAGTQIISAEEAPECSD